MRKLNFPYITKPLPEWIGPVVAKVFAKMCDDTTGHDFLHAVRVMELSASIADELHADVDIAAAAGLMHDYYRKEEKLSGQLHFGLEAIEELRREFGSLIIPEIGEKAFANILDVIAVHESYNTNAVLSLDAQILQDADRLEAIGAVGIARTFMFGGAHGLPMIEEEQKSTVSAFDPNVPPNGSVHIHFYEKLLKLADGMHTAPGRRMAEQRHQVMTAFLKQFENELGLSSPEVTALK
ncbi:HD domain-containing protein [Paenibacillus sp. NPDC057934]|uniref:HD domain-containing protein n=1 Tax=Paenibacillus sp. NPDC057934 TaxID=3346282 RepID=UPI0036DBDCEC